MLKIRLLIASLFIISISQAQTQTYIVRGILQDMTDKTPIQGATIKISAQDTALTAQLVTPASGAFRFNDLPPRIYKLTISAVGYGEVSQTIKIDTGDVDMGIVPFSKETKVLGEVNIRVTAPAVRQKVDTVEYSASSFKVNPDANAEDMIRKMPGVTVEKGNVTAQGEQVRKVTIDGRDFFGDDATAALRNMPAEVIDKIQVFDRLSDQAAFTGFDDGSGTKAINIVTKANMRNGNFGRVFAGYGTDERYSAGGNVSFFNGNRRISLVGLTNNVNQQNFATQDLLGATSTPSRGGNRGQGGGGRPGGQGGGGRPGGFGGGGNQESFLVGQQPGISRTNSFGINYSDLWAKKVTVSGSYFYNNNRLTNAELANRQYLLSGDTSQFYTENSTSINNNYNHRVNLRMEYKIDSSNTLIFTPSLNFQNNTSIDNSVAYMFGSNSSVSNDPISQTTNFNSRSTKGNNLNAGLLYRHAFTKRGRTISLNLNAGSNTREGEVITIANSEFYKSAGLTDSLRIFQDQTTKGYNLSANLAYTEPIGKKGQLQLNYYPSYSSSNADHRTFEYDNGSGKYSTFDRFLSNRFINDVTTQNGGVTFRVGDRDNMYSVGLSYQESQLESEQRLPYYAVVNKSFRNILPNAMVRLKLSSKANLRLNYRSSTNVPSISQLQDVIDQSNPLSLRTGNPDLKQQYSNTFFSRYQYTNTTKGLSLFANLFLQNTKDYIGNALFTTAADSVLNPSVTLLKGGQLSKPVNLDGFWSARSFVTFGMPLKFIKSTINWNLGYNYSKIPGLIQTPRGGRQETVTKSNNFNLGAVIASNISENVDFNVSYSGTFNNINSSIRTGANDKYFTHSAGAQLNLISKKGWLLQNDVTNQFLSGTTLDQNFWLWNVSAGKKFLKDQAGELRVSVFDLLKQNKNFSRTVAATGEYIEDVQNTVLQQYFMLTFSYRLKNFTKARQTTNQRP
jgi:uncharacterized membrane protein YgcG